MVCLILRGRCLLLCLQKRSLLPTKKLRRSPPARWARSVASTFLEDVVAIVQTEEIPPELILTRRGSRSCRPTRRPWTIKVPSEWRWLESMTSVSSRLYFVARLWVFFCRSKSSTKGKQHAANPAMSFPLIGISPILPSIGPTRRP